MTPAEFRTIRAAANLSQPKLAARLRVSDRMVRYYETGACPIPGPVQVLMEQIGAQS